jgi:hypothetical protein
MISRPCQCDIEVGPDLFESHQVLINLNRTPDRWVMSFPIKHYRAADEPKVQLW